MTNLPPKPLRSCLALNWLVKPGEPVRWYMRSQPGSKYNEARWIEISEAEARRIAKLGSAR